MVLKTAKNVSIKLKQLLGYVVQGDPFNFATQFHLEEK